MKKLLVLVLSMILVFGAASTVCAADKVLSPTGTPSDEEGKEPDAPKTGESNMVLYIAACALVLGGCAVIARKRLEA